MSADDVRVIGLAIMAGKIEPSERQIRNEVLQDMALEMRKEAANLGEWIIDRIFQFGWPSKGKGPRAKTLKVAKDLAGLMAGIQACELVVEERKLTLPQWTERPYMTGLLNSFGITESQGYCLHTGEPFEQLISGADAIHARALGIRL